MSTYTDDKVFLDTNVWIYYYSNDIKSSVAKNLIIANYDNILISTQSLNELYTVLTRKQFVANHEAKDIINKLICDFEILLVETETIQQAMKIQSKYKLQYFDSLLLATALENRCKYFYFEYMQNNLTIADQLIIVNPFKNH